jgi:hypothetical protein
VLRKITFWAVVMFIIFYVATQPSAAAVVVRHAYDGLHEAATSLATFVNAL